MIDPKLFKLAAEQTADYAVFLLDENGNIVSWNLGAQRIKGYAPDEIIGKHFSIFYPRDSVESGWPAHELEVAVSEGRFEDEGWRVRKDGSRFWASVVITALRDPAGKLLGFSKITRDLTDRKLHEEALAQSEQRFRLLVDGVTDYAIFMLDPEGIVTSWNTGAVHMKGYRSDEIIGQHFSRFFTPDDVESGKPWEGLAAARATGRSESEGWRVKKGGERFWARAVLNALHDSAGHLRGFAKVTQDLTERRHVQALQEAARNVNEFIAVLAHELRNPLAPIMTAVSVIERTKPGAPGREEMHGIIARQSAKLARIVDDMLDIARVTRGELQIERARVELSNIARQAAETAAPAIDAGKHRLEMELADEAMYVHGDPHRLAQVVANLLNNAARYTAEGGHITIRTRADRGWAVLTVRDTGCGIDPNLTERIFDMFVHGRPAIARVGGGLGIGLALSRRITELHGGTLYATSEGDDKGSELTLRIPLAGIDADRAEAPLQPVAAAAADKTARRVLVVDDNVDAAETLQILLQSLGHETAIAHTGIDALQLAPRFRPDIVLLDIGLPGIDGYEVARRLRSIEKGGQMKIVAVTGWGQDADKQKSTEAGFDLHLVKPLRPADLLRALADRNGATLLQGG